MTNEDLHQEIELLRQQLDAIQRQADTAPAVPELADEDDSTETVTAEDETQAEDLLAQLKELLEYIKDPKPTTLLIVFALGVLVGRL